MPHAKNIKHTWDCELPKAGGRVAGCISSFAKCMETLFCLNQALRIKHHFCSMECSNKESNFVTHSQLTTCSLLQGAAPYIVLKFRIYSIRHCPYLAVSLVKYSVQTFQMCDAVSPLYGNCSIYNKVYTYRRTGTPAVQS